LAQTSRTRPAGGRLAQHGKATRANQGLHALHLRAGYFMENTLAQIGIIKSFGMMAGPVRADVLLAMIATRDIGVAAAEALLRLDFEGQKTQELLGPRDMTYTEAAKIIGTAIGRPGLAYIQLPDEQVIQAMTEMGISRNMAELLCEMSAAINSGYMKALEPRSAKNTTPTPFETFVEEVFCRRLRLKRPVHNPGKQSGPPQKTGPATFSATGYACERCGLVPRFSA